MMKRLLKIFILTSIKRCWTYGEVRTSSTDEVTLSRHRYPDDWRLPEEDNILGKPFNFTATEITASSISLRWAMNTSYDLIKGYWFSYKRYKYDPFEDSTYYYLNKFFIWGSDPAYKLNGLIPNTMYEVWIEPKGMVHTDKGEQSEIIIATTDTAAPSAPQIKNVTCYDTQKIYLEWKRPTTYMNVPKYMQDKNVDYYYIYHKKALENSYKDYVKIQASSEFVQRFLLDKEYVDVATEYCVKISAGIWSTQFNEMYKSDFSDEMCVDMPQVGCIFYPSISEEPSLALELGVFIIPITCLLLFV